MIEYVTPNDLNVINKALNNGADVRIQLTPNQGYRIVSDRVMVLKRESREMPQRPLDRNQ